MIGKILGADKKNKHMPLNKCTWWNEKYQHRVAHKRGNNGCLSQKICHYTFFYSSDECWLF